MTRMSDTPDYLYQEVAESIRRRIAAGDLRAGEKLPAIRHMAEQWDCTPGTVNRAYRLLAEEGLLVAHRGSGTRVASSHLESGSAPGQGQGASGRSPSVWGWATLVNRAEQYLLEAVAGGYEPAQIQSALTVALARWESLQETALTDSGGGESDRAENLLRFAGSHDLLINILAQMLQETQPPVSLDVTYSGSLGGLMALARGEADVAGAHLWDGVTDSYNEPFVRRLLPGRRVALLTLAYRSQGLIVAPDNPKEISELRHLVKPGVRFANRQAGSGTRVWLDAKLAESGISKRDVSGYEQEATTHLDVARAVAEGKADVALGIHAAAAAFDLTFIPLMRERYDLVFMEEGWQSEPAQQLRRLLTSDAFLRAVESLGGYDTARTGQVLWLEATP